MSEEGASLTRLSTNETSDLLWSFVTNMEQEFPAKNEKENALHKAT
jgi:hypothetical protein